MLVALMIAAMAATQTAQQFDLVCTGTAMDAGDYQQTETRPSNTRIRIDLQRGLWCVNDCGHHSPFVSVSPTELVMEDFESPNLEVYRSVNRTNGHYSVSVRSIVQGTVGATHSSEQCERAPYTPIPAAKF